MLFIKGDPRSTRISRFVFMLNLNKEKEKRKHTQREEVRRNKNGVETQTSKQGGRQKTDCERS